jgi:choline dehydrogenase-like flavoprotein
MLSIAFADWIGGQQSRTVLDTVVIGSGYGGSVAALRLAEMGHEVVLLERGSEYLPGDFPNEFGQLPKYQRFPGPNGPLGRPSGLFDWHLGSSFAALVGNGLGGGSLINAGVVMRPDGEVFSQSAWPNPIRHGTDSQDHLSLPAAFAKARAELRPQNVAERHATRNGLADLPKAQALGRLGDAIARSSRLKPDLVGVQTADVTVDFANCTRCGDCFSGCNVPGAKTTLTQSYLAKAYDAGAVLVCGALVWTIEPQADGIWALSCIATERSGQGRGPQAVANQEGVRVLAKRVVVSAGTFGSTELLQRSQARFGAAFPLSPALGTRLSGNGDSLSASVDEKQDVGALGRGSLTIDPSAPVGPTITSIIDLRNRPNLYERLVIQEGAVPGALVGVFQEILATAWVLSQIGSKRRDPRHSGTSDSLSAPRALAAHSQLLLTMGHDRSAGLIVYMPGMDSSVPYWVRPEEETTYKHQADVLALCNELGGRHLDSPLWKLLPDAAVKAMGQPLLAPTTLTVHPLGGCPMGDRFADAVVDHRGRVFQPNGEVWATLFVLDGSIVPTSLGCNPLWTITALAERSMAYAAQEVDRKAIGIRPLRELIPAKRDPQPVARRASQTIDVALKERLVCASLSLGATMKQFFGLPNVQASLSVQMRSTDWPQLWFEKVHRISDVKGSLVLHEPLSKRTVRYRVARGEIDLLDVDPQFRLPLTSSIRALVTWFIMRGYRDFRHALSNGGTASIWALAGSASGLWNMLVQAGGDRRIVRYTLRLERTIAPSDSKLPESLDLTASKHIGYAATWGELGSYMWRRYVLRQATAPSSLRAAYAEQLTSPIVKLSYRQQLAGWPALEILKSAGTGRFTLDTRSALRNSPAELLGGADSSEGMPLLAAYPSLVMRHALRTRIFDFRLPDYSGTPVEDLVSSDDLFLRAAPAGTLHDVTPSLKYVRVRRGRSSADDGTEDQSNLHLPLWRYARTDALGEKTRPELRTGHWHELPVRRAKSVLLMHAFGMSGSTFTFKTTSCNLAEFFYSNGYEVWIFDSRMSPRVNGSALQQTLDQVGLIDTPAAVEAVLEILRKEFGAGHPLQIFSFAHCLGAGATLISLLGGRLHYQERSAAALGALLPKLAGLVCSQVHPFMVGSNNSMSKTWVAPAVRNMLGRTNIPLAVRGPVTSLVDQLLDRIFASMPIPLGERCPEEAETARRFDDDCVTCRRIRFMDGELFKHRNLNIATHKSLPHLFGPANVRLFAHGSKILDYERLVTEDGINAYATDEAITRHLSLPLRFVHGEENDLFSSESAIRSSKQFGRLQPAMAMQFACERSGGAHHLIHGYGHLDLLIGSDLEMPRDGTPAVYEQLAELLDIAWATAAHGSVSAADVGRAGEDLRFPAIGPWISPAKVDSDGVHRVGVAFVLDDLTKAASPPGSALRAAAIVHEPHGTTTYDLQVKGFPAPLVVRDGYLLPKRRLGNSDATEDSTSVRVAYGRLPVSVEGQPLRAELVSYSDPSPEGGLPYARMAGAAPAAGTIGSVATMAESLVTRGQATIQLTRRRGYVRGDHAARPAIVGPRANLLESIERARHSQLVSQVDNNVPYPSTPSELRRSPVKAANRWIHVRSGILGQPGPHDEVRLAIGCCRYPGFPFDAGRADETFGRLLAVVRGNPRNRPHAGLMLGDQIYADASARLDDPLSAIERFHRRHAAAFATKNMRRLLAALPFVMTPDDHEFCDNYPTGATLYDGASNSKRYASLREIALRAAANDAVTAFQFMTTDAPAFATGCFTFSLGHVRIIVIDTRTNRVRAGNGINILSSVQKLTVEQWVKASDKDTLQVICSGSVVFPSIVPGTDPANPGPSDSWDDSPDEREWLLSLLAQEVPRRFVLVSGDYHLTAGAMVLDREEPVGVAIVAPAFYAPLPYANSVASDLSMSESLQAGDHRFSLGLGMKTLIGSGFGMVRLKHTPGAGSVRASWSVVLDTDIDDHTADAGAAPGWTGLRRSGSWTL